MYQQLAIESTVSKYAKVKEAIFKSSVVMHLVENCNNNDTYQVLGITFARDLLPTSNDKSTESQRRLKPSKHFHIGSKIP